ncbi:leucyl aminopeptidase family protein [Pilimelia terevasa]|uniref:leucyl aminopeptidase family protein n=1 Tax=Pilimelia terevasa TaxID=53372 RepID=UPI001E2A3CE7|nr:leucyl aminopeptidase family protein [Pilimelia terevasa]
MLAVTVGGDGVDRAALPADLAHAVRALLDGADQPGRAGAVQRLPRPLARPATLLLAGVGDGTEADWRAAGAALARTGAAPFTVAVPADAPAEAVRGLAEGLMLASYRFVAEKRAPKDAAVTLALADPDRYADALATAAATAAATALARDLTNTPSSRKNPAWFAQQARRAAADAPHTQVRVWEPAALAEEGFGALLAVGGGSATPPRLVEVQYRPRGAKTHVVLVGKGITFDTGGLSIKPADAMKLMRKDMGGAAAVLGATVGAAALRLPVRITAVLPLAENAVSGDAYRPGDVLTHYDGRTSEITNTDAEGRLVLADALGYAVRRLRPDVLVDLATLTGANAIALGKRHAALYSDDDELAGALAAAGAAAGERAWRMPLPADYVEYLSSDLADLFPAPERGAGSVVAALYLREFTGELRDRWAHFDMSAPSWSDAAEGELTKGATGWGVRTLLRWLATA